MLHSIPHHLKSVALLRFEWHLRGNALNEVKFGGDEYVEAEQFCGVLGLWCHRSLQSETFIEEPTFKNIQLQTKLQHVKSTVVAIFYHQKSTKRDELKSKDLIVQFVHTMRRAVNTIMQHNSGSALRRYLRAWSSVLFTVKITDCKTIGLCYT